MRLTTSRDRVINVYAERERLAAPPDLRCRGFLADGWRCPAEGEIVDGRRC